MVFLLKWQVVNAFFCPFFPPVPSVCITLLWSVYCLWFLVLTPCLSEQPSPDTVSCPQSPATPHCPTWELLLEKRRQVSFWWKQILTTMLHMISYSKRSTAFAVWVLATRFLLTHPLSLEDFQMKRWYRRSSAQWKAAAFTEPSSPSLLLRYLLNLFCEVAF